MSGVTSGENAIGAANVFVTKDSAVNTIIGGIPAKVLKSFDNQR